MVTAAATATVNRIPVLLLPGDNFACRQPDPVLQQIENPSDYTISATDAFKPVSKYWDRIVRPEQLMTAAMNAMRVLTDPVDTGAVTLALPQDVQCESYEYPAEFFQKRVHTVQRRAVASATLKAAVDLIASKQQPLIIAGGGVHYALAENELARFAEAFGIPVGETQAGKSALPWNHPLNAGAIGATGTLMANVLAKDTDLVIGIGTRFSDFTTSSKSAFQNKDVTFISINISALDTVKMNAFGVQADAKEALSALHAALSQLDYKATYEPEYIQSLKETWNAEVERLYAIELEEGLSQTRVLGEINRWMDESSVIVCAAGSLPGDLHRLWRSVQPKTYHMEYGFSCMGYEVSGAFGVKMAEPSREVYAMVGDGSYLMLHSELVTSIQEGYKMNVLLFDNHGYQCIHNLQRAHGSEGFGNEFRFRSEDAGHVKGAYMQMDFAAHARSMGAKTFTATTVAELHEALELALIETASTLIDIKVLPGTSTSDYESWWRVGVAEVSTSPKVRQAFEDMQAKVLQNKERGLWAI
jgi:3D-(3,5/4)-trihydroxycyclohexane-1,2-dione acylhydrolase (decyclizing)